MNKLVHLGLSILELSKILRYKYWYDYVKPKHDAKTNLCYVDTDSFIAYINADDIYKDITQDVETKFDASNYELDRPLQKGKKVTELKKDELGRKVMKTFVGLRAKTFSYLIDDGSKDKKKAKGTKKCIIKRKLDLEIIKTF